MLVPEFDVAVVDSFGNVFADLMRRSTIDHVVSRPSVLSLCTGRCTDEQVVLELTLQVILLDMLC